MVFLMKISRIIVLLMILIFTAGMVYAVDLSEFKAPSNFEGDGNGSFYELNDLGIMDENGISIEIYNVESMMETAKQAGLDENNSEDSDFFTNNSALNYTVESSDEENIFYYTDGVNEIEGYVELVKVGDEKVYIETTIDKGASEDKLKQSLDVLKEFNKLNNLDPINPI